MKRILFLLSLLPYLASAQVAKDTVTVLTIAQIPAGAIRDTTNFTFVQDNAFNKATFDSLAKYTRVKLIGDRGDITVSGATGLTWELDAGVVDSMQLSAGAVVLPGAKVTGTLPVGKGGTGLTTLTGANRIPYSTSATALTTSSNLSFDGTNLGIGTSSPTANLDVTATATTIFGTEVSNSISPPEIGFRKARGSIGSDTAVAIGDFLGSFGFYGRGSNAYSIGASIDSKVEDVGTNVYGNIIFGTRDNVSGNLETRLMVENSGKTGIGTETPAYKLDVNGNVRADTYYSDDNSFIQTPSDIELKKNIEPLSGMLEKINKLNPVSYEWNDLRLDQMQNRDGAYKMYGTKIGLLAQDVYNVFPEFTGEDAEGNMTVSYISLIVPMLKAIQEQQQQIEQLKQRITQLENK